MCCLVTEFATNATIFMNVTLIREIVAGPLPSLTDVLGMDVIAICLASQLHQYLVKSLTLFFQTIANDHASFITITRYALWSILALLPWLYGIWLLSQRDKWRMQMS